MANKDLKHHFGGNCTCCTPVSRRSMLMATGGAFAALAVASPNPASAQTSGGDNVLEQLTRANQPNRRVLIRGGMVYSVDPAVGNFARGDVLLEGTKISAVGPSLNATADVTIDAQGMIVMPGFIDTHHHQYQTILRGILADGTLGRFDRAAKHYINVILGTYGVAYRPEDAYISELIASLSQLSAGVTTTVDTSQVSHTPEHTDACIAGLRESGQRALFAYAGGAGQNTKFPGDIERLRRQYFSSADQLLTLGMNTQMNAAHWALARSVGAPIISHVVGKHFGDLETMGRAGLMGPDNEYIHCTEISDTTWKMIQDTGGKLSIATTIEMQMGHGMPPLQKAIDMGFKLSLSSDVECSMTADMFTIMRSTFTLQRAQVHQRGIQGDTNLPRLLTSADVIEMATMGGARVAHLDSKVGSLTPGKEADIIMLSTDRLNIMPLNNVPGAVVTLMDTSNVENVFVAGKAVKWRGAMVNVDMPRLRRLATGARDGLLSRAGQTLDLFGSCCVQ